MRHRIIVVLMLLLLPLQWSAAQAHEYRDNASMVTISVQADTAISPSLAFHLQEPGGVCQFHQMAQPHFTLDRSGVSNSAVVDANEWLVPPSLTHNAVGRHEDIERPKWVLARRSW